MLIHRPGQMRHYRIIIAAIALAAPQAWAFSPYYPYPVYAPPAPPGYYGSPMVVHYAPMAPYRPYAGPFQRPSTWNPAVQNSPSRTVVRKPAAVAKRPAAAAAKQAISTEAATPTAAKQTTDTVSTGVDDSRSAFLQRLLPLVDEVNQRLLRERDSVKTLFSHLERGKTLSDKQKSRLKTLASRYRVDGDPLEDADARTELLKRIDIVPASLALAQAANESAWGNSRFAKQGNNLFGIWTYDETQGIVPRKREPGKKHLVRKFDSEAESVSYYVHTLNSHPAYASLRDIRATLRTAGKPLDGHVMADGLTRYSARGEEYVETIRTMIRRFDLAAYDTGIPKA